MSIDQILTTLGLIGLGGILQSIINYIINSRKEKNDSKQKLKETRYKAVVLLCYAFANYEEEHSRLVIQRPNIESKSQLYQELNAEWVNMSLYGSDGVILRMRDFLVKQDNISYSRLILEMRKDLFGVKSKLNSMTYELDLLTRFEGVKKQEKVGLDKT